MSAYFYKVINYDKINENVYLFTVILHQLSLKFKNTIENINVLSLTHLDMIFFLSFHTKNSS